ncbi:hypothetical protein PhCBS80983_g01436 [Powellomyces hirtus]|uniref:CRAL-TRIO domain-containing protein n=1 Tax=Powellomyces hirtus TaxID=109895 RepID=A0A507EAQ4_9FUNG|nr:hypothetical protein PhCBS80983_g01436 [Powellomyces hirtus]
MINISTKRNAIAPVTPQPSSKPTSLQDLDRALSTSPRIAQLGVTQLTDWWKLMFLSTHKGDIDATLHAIERLLVWRQSYGWNDLPNENFPAELAAAKFYFHKRDMEGFPVLIWRMDRHTASKNQEEVEHNVRFLVWFMEKAIREGIIQNRVTILIDRLHITSHNTESLQFVRHAIPNIQTALPEIIHKVVVFPTSTLVYALWKMAQTLLNPRVVGKITMCGGGDYQKALKEVVDGERLSRKYGGTSTDLLDEPGWEERAKARQGIWWDK